MIASHPVEYAIVPVGTLVVKSIRGEFYGFHVNSGAGTITVTDNGVTVYAGNLAADQNVNFGGCGILCKSNISVTVTGTASVAVLYV